MVARGSPFTIMNIPNLDDIPTSDLYTLYAAEALSHRIITHAEEMEFGRLKDEGMQAGHKLEKGLYKTNKQRTDLERAVRAGKLAIDSLTRANLRLVFSEVKKYYHPLPGNTLGIMDVVQEGNIGLQRAVLKYDYRLGHKFSTYATWWIRQAVTRVVTQQNRSIRIPVHVAEDIARYNRVRAKMEQATGIEPTNTQLAVELGWAPYKMRRITDAMREVDSLDRPIGDEGGTSVLGDMVAGDFETSESSETAELRNAIAALLNDETIFSPREASIIRLRYGFHGGEPMTLEQVGAKYGLTRERIRQIEVGVMQKLRHPRRARKLRQFL